MNQEERTVETVLTAEDRLQELELKVDRILELTEQTYIEAHPPWYKRVLKFIFRHLLVIILLIFIAIIVWRVWNIVQELRSKLEGVKQFVVDKYSEIADMIPDFPDFPFID
jgi:hypothetical protein